MKKSLIALAALATFATAAQAQSSVTIYGIVDAGISTVDDDAAAGRVTGVHSGALSTSRFGFKGTEDLGGGLKANFTLEGQFSTDTGAQPAGAFFVRGSFVQLDQANVGSISLGRQNGLDYVNVIAGDAFGAANIGGFIPVAYNGSGVNSTSYNRFDNAVTLQSANFAGFTVAYQLAMGEQAGDTGKLKNEAFRITYTYGKLNLSAASRERKGASGAKEETVSNYFANYDFGVAKGFLGYQEKDPASGAKVKATSVGVVVPVNAKVNLMAAYHDVENANGTGGDGKAYGLGATYALSKRTTLYALHGATDVDATAKLQSGSTYTVGGTAGKDNTMTAVGIRHSF